MALSPAAWFDAAGRGGEPVAQGGQRAHGDGLDGFAVDLGGAGEGHAEGVDRVEEAEVAFAGAAHHLRVDHHPLVAQPHHGPVGLGQFVHLGLAEPLPAEGDLPAELQEPVGVEEGGAVGGGAGRAAYLGLGGQLPGQFPGPVHGDPGGAQPLGGHPEQVGEFRVVQRQDVGDGLVGEAFQRGPDAGGAAQGEGGVDPGARAEAGQPLARPEGGGVGDPGGVGEAVDLEDGGPGAPAALLALGVEEAVRGEVEAEREADPGVLSGGGQRGPAACPGQPLGRGGGEGRAEGVGGGRGAGQRVGDGVEEGTQQASGAGTRSGERPSRATGCPSGGRAAARSRRRSRSVASSGPARQASSSASVRPGSRRPRATRSRASRAAACQQAADAPGAGSASRAARPSSTPRTAASTATRRTVVPRARATVRVVVAPVSRGGAPPSGDHQARRPRRGSTAGRKVTALACPAHRWAPVRLTACWWRPGRPRPRRSACG